MGKPKRDGSGFSATKPGVAPKQQVANSSADPAAREQQAVALINQGKHPEAEAIFRELIAAGTNNHIVYVNLAAICGMQSRWGETTLLLKQALRLNPNHPGAYNNLGIALRDKGDLNAAINSYKTALSLKPNYPEAHYNLGNVLKEQGDLNAAINSYKTALSLKPNYPDAHKNLSMAELLIGDYKNGWKRYEYRFQCKKDQNSLHSNPNCSQWKGKPLKAKDQLLLVSEQGLGDTLQFMRYALALKNQGIAVSLCAKTKLHSLIRASGVDPYPVSPEDANKFSKGQWSPLLSVPRYLDVSPGNPIITEPYIKTTNELITKWQYILAGEKRPIIGINWQGNPRVEKTILKGRSLPLETFAPIAQYPNASLLSLQKDLGSEQLENSSFKDHFVSCQQQINETWDFLETAAIIANCDLVITSDTCVAHLAGGMGKTTWLLLHKVPDWRWGLKEETSFWYPSMRLFRQQDRGHWDEVMEQVLTDLKSHF